MKQLVDQSPLVKRLATGLLLLILLLYPMSHTPLLPHLGISPFQLLSILVGAVGVVSSLIWLAQNYQKLSAKIKENPVLTCLAVFMVWLSLSYLWGHNRHQFYFIALAWLGVSFAFGVYVLGRLSSFRSSTIAKYIAIVGVALSLIGLYQFVGDSLGLSRKFSQICITCMTSSLSFARPSGFSQEPQYFSTILLLPLCLWLYWLIKKSKGTQIWGWLGVASIITSLLLSSSRGGLLALLVVLVGFAILAIWRRSYKFLVLLGVELLIAIGLAISLVAWAGSLAGHQGASFTVDRYISHVSGGKIALGSESTRIKAIDQSINQQKAVNPQNYHYISQATNYGQTGAVIFSTESRLETYKTALHLWKRSAKTILIGIGWGNFGQVAHDQQPNVFLSSSVVNNQLLQIGTELGLVGLVLALIVVALLVRAIWLSKLEPLAKYVILLLLLGYAVQLQFYSAFHLLQFWLVFGLLFYLLNANAKDGILNKKRNHITAK